MSYCFEIGGKVIPNRENFVYLGLPVGDSQFVCQFMDLKFRNVEKATFSFKGLGLVPKGTCPLTISYLYKTYCQSIIRYPLDNLMLSDCKLKEFNTRQNMIVRHLVGIKNKFSKMKPLLEALKLDEITHIYFKHKLSFTCQISNNKLTNDVYIFLKELYSSNKVPRMSFEKQVRSLEKIIARRIDRDSHNNLSNLLKNRFTCSNRGLVDSVKYILHQIHTNVMKERNYFDSLKILNLLLVLDFG